MTKREDMLYEYDENMRLLKVTCPWWGKCPHWGCGWCNKCSQAIAEEVKEEGDNNPSS